MANRYGVTGRTRYPRMNGVGFTLVLASVAVNAFAAEVTPPYPVKPLRLVVPFVAGGGVDVVMRPVAEKLAEVLQKPVVVDNRGGAAGAIGADLVAGSPADGYTLLAVSSSLAVNQAIRAKTSYDLIHDFVAITQLTAQPYFITAHASVPVRTIPELIALAKAKPGTINYASSGTGGLQHLAGAMLAKMAGVNMVHVAYKGGGAAHNDLVAGQIQLEATLPLTTNQFVKSGRLRYLAVTSLKRIPAFPDVPPVADTLPGYEIDAWYGVMAPAKTPASLIALLNREIVAVLKRPDIGGRFAADGMIPVGSSAKEFSTHIVAELAKWRSVVKSVGLDVE